MAGLEEQLGLDVSPALSAVEEIDRALQAAVTAFSETLSAALDSLSAPVDVPVTADTTSAEASLDAIQPDPEEIEVSADVSDAEASIDAVTADVPEVEIVAVADTDDAQAALDELDGAELEATISVDSSGIQEASDDVEDFSASATQASGSANALAGATTAATLSGHSMSTVFGQAKGVMSGAAGVIGLTTVGLSALFASGLDVVSSQQRVNAVFGDFSDELDTINVGDLNADLEELAISLGSDDEALQQAAASLGFFAQSAGASQEESEKFTENVIALAARAKALRPDLGDLATIVGKLPRALIRGGAAAAQFGVSLTRAEVDAFAESIGLIPEALAPAERAMVAAQLLAERFGKGLASAVETGTQNAEIRFQAFQQRLLKVGESIGAPLVDPILELLESLVPPMTALADAAAGVLVPALDLLAPIFSALEPVLTAFSAGLEFISPILPFVAGGIVAVAAALKLLVASPILANPLTLVNPWLAAAVAIAAVVTAIGFLVQGQESAAERAEQLNSAIFGNVKSVDDLRRAAEEYTTRLADTIEEQERFGNEQGEISDALRQSGGDLKQLAAGLAGTEAEWRKQRAALVEVLDATEEKAQADAESAQESIKAAQARQKAIDELDEERKATIDSIEAKLKELVTNGALEESQRKAALSQAKNARGQIDYAKAVDLATIAVQKNAAEQARLDAEATADTIEKNTAAMFAYADAAARGALSSAELTTKFLEMGLSSQQATAFFDEVTNSVNEFVGSVIGTLPTASQAFEDYTSGVEQAGDRLRDAQIERFFAETPEAAQEAAAKLKLAEQAFAEATDPQRLIENLAAQVESIKSWATNMETVAALGPEIAAQIAQMGPDAVAAAAKGIREQGPTFVAQMQMVFGAGAAAGADAIAIATELGIPAARQAAIDLATGQNEGYDSTLDWVTPTTSQTTAVGTEIDRSAPVNEQKAGAAARASRIAWETEFGKTPASVKPTMDATGAAITTTAPKAQAGAAGTATGDEFAGGYNPQPGVEAATSEVGNVFTPTAMFVLRNDALEGGKTVGDAFALGVKQGIDAGTDQWVLPAARDMVDDAITAAQEEADAHSPSRVFAALGVSMAEGLAGGLASGESLVTAAGTAIAGAAIPRVSSGSLSTTSGGIGQIVINVSGAVDPASATLVGNRIGQGIVRQLVRRNVVQQVRANV